MKTDHRVIAPYTANCPTCGYNFRRGEIKAERERERLDHYRKALYLACGNDKKRVIEMMKQAEDLLV